jgi:hypothetical protein
MILHICLFLIRNSLFFCYLESRNMKLKILLSSFLLISSSFAGSGAGGQIRYTNGSKYQVNVLFGGTGCAGINHGHTLICEQKENVAPGETVEYKYNWGVTKTWIWTYVNDRDDDISTTAYEWSNFTFTGF